MAKVQLLHNTPLWVAAKAIRTAWDSFDKGDTVDGEVGPKDKDLIYKVGNKFKHSSTLEHLVYTFEIKEISRAVLAELSRHRIASLTVKSTRYTLKELKEADKILWDSAQEYLVFTGNEKVDRASVLALQNLQELLKQGISNDIAKYSLPESYKTELVWTVNARSLQNFLTLRTNKSALWEIRELAHAIYEAIPIDHKYLFDECIYSSEEKDG